MAFLLPGSKVAGLSAQHPVGREEGVLSTLTQSPTARQFSRYSVVGLSGFVVDFGLYGLLTRGLGLYYLAANVLSFSAAVVNTFIWHKRWTFRDQAAAAKRLAPDATPPLALASPAPLRRLSFQFAVFVSVSVVGLALNSSILHAVSQHGLTQVTFGSRADLFAKLVATGIVWFWNFGANKLWTFRKG